ncbi:serine hydrolase domain-containing protein [Pedobacter ginsengisoli]|uniref:serine hydrolase domain-containing protein n=1 Tax=Pedobacter ginsengisoli TaxID=363852 RepID=UPI00254BE78F|nr:serine hydrolase [Pedobacter ginsengisoli]
MRVCLLLTIALLLCKAALFGQQKDLVKNAGITSSIHKSSVGKILFSSKQVSVPDLKGAEFLETYELTNKSDLFMTCFMANSMTNYLHRLAPGMHRDTLLSHGNYQASFYVDNRLVYQTNLLPGAPQPWLQDTVTVMSKPLISDKSSWWSQSMWNRFMVNGGDSVLTDGPHAFKMELRPYINISGLKTGDLIASGHLNMQVHRKVRIDIAKIDLNPIKPYPGLPVSKECFNVSMIKELKGNINEGLFKHISSIVVIKDGKLLVEEYFNGSDRDSLHDPRSVGKSFASTMTGIAIGDGYLKNEDQTLKEFYNLKSLPDYSPEKENVSVGDLLSMNSAFNGDDDDGNSPGNEENMYDQPDWVKFTLSLPASETAKSKWHYFTAGVILLGDILNKQIPGGLERYTDEKLFKPLAITNYKWAYTPQNLPNTAGSIQMNALDFAKYGQLYKNEGKWNGKQVIPKEWVRKTFTKHRLITGRTGEYYGYLFWNKKYKVADKEYETFYCAGNGGNKIYIFKDQPLVIVVTATAYGAYYAHPQVDKMMENYILPAVLTDCAPVRRGAGSRP